MKRISDKALQDFRAEINKGITNGEIVGRADSYHNWLNELVDLDKLSKEGYIIASIKNPERFITSSNNLVLFPRYTLYEVEEQLKVYYEIVFRGYINIKRYDDLERLREEWKQKTGRRPNMYVSGPIKEKSSLQL